MRSCGAPRPCTAACMKSSIGARAPERGRASLAHCSSAGLAGVWDVRLASAMRGNESRAEVRLRLGAGGRDRLTGSTCGLGEGFGQGRPADATGPTGPVEVDDIGQLTVLAARLMPDVPALRAEA